MTKEKFTFQAEVSKLLDIVAHSLYSHKEIFLRELISNASDACDKLRYEALTKPKLTAGEPEFRITIKADEKAGTLTVSDNGLGDKTNKARGGPVFESRENLLGSGFCAERRVLEDASKNGTKRAFHGVRPGGRTGRGARRR